MTVRCAVVTCALVALASSASAQSGSSGTSTEPLTPATTTFLGDTGLWFVPTAEVLASGKWSGSGYRRGTNYIQGFSNIGDFAGTAAYGFRDRAEVFASLLFDTRIDRDLRPIFINDQKVGGVVSQYPGVNQYWTGNSVGDLYLGAKVNIWSQRQSKPVAMAVRGILKAPTGDSDKGVSTGKTDFLADFVVSKNMKRNAELAAYGGYEWSGQPDIVADGPGGAFRWGVGTGVSFKTSLIADFEVNGIEIGRASCRERV